MSLAVCEQLLRLRKGWIKEICISESKAKVKKRKITVEKYIEKGSSRKRK